MIFKWLLARLRGEDKLLEFLRNTIFLNYKGDTISAQLDGLILSVLNKTEFRSYPRYPDIFPILDVNNIHGLYTKFLDPQKQNFSKLSRRCVDFDIVKKNREKLKTYDGSLSLGINPNTGEILSFGCSEGIIGNVVNLGVSLDHGIINFLEYSKEMKLSGKVLNTLAVSLHSYI